MRKCQPVEDAGDVSLFGIVLKLCAGVGGSHTWSRHIHTKIRSGNRSQGVSLHKCPQESYFAVASGCGLTCDETQVAIAPDEAGHMNVLLSVSLRVAQNAEIIPA